MIPANHQPASPAPRSPLTGTLAVTTFALGMFHSAEARSSEAASGRADIASVGELVPYASTQAENAGAVFMLGLIGGMVMGISMFFIHLRRREKRLDRFRVDDMMLDNWPCASKPPSSTTPTSQWDPAPSDEMIESSEPWERSVDWWKNPDEQ